MRLDRRSLFTVRSALVVPLLLALLVPSAPAGAQEEGATVSAALAEGGSLWFVELSSAPTADGGKPSDAAKDKAAFRSEAKKAGVAHRERYAFDTLWNGLSIEVDPLDVPKLARLPGVKALYPVVTVQLDTAGEPAPELFSALAMTGADVAQSALGLSGHGVRVAVMDTGIDYDHPDLGGCFGPGCRVETGWDFVGDAFNADSTSPSFNPVPVPDADPDDCGGHGTHVAGIVGADGFVRGVAPAVTFGAYRVFGCQGSTTADIMLAAMERALADDMDVLNMSIGSAFQWPTYPTAQGADRLVNRGVVVVASIGNNGANGLYSSSAPGIGKKVIGVAAVDNTHVTLPIFTVSPDDQVMGYNTATASPPPPTSGTYPMKRTGTATSAADACNGATAPPPGSLTGFVALIRRGTCGFYEKAKNAEAAGAVAVVLYNNVAGRINPTVAGTPPVVIPVVAVSDVEGLLLDSRLAAGPVSMTWTDQLGSFPNANPGLTASFSSYGLAPDLSLKPDITAPGGAIFSTFPLERGAYATLGGTSMSSPHTAGAVALLLEARPHTPAQAVRSILQNSADPIVWWGNPGLGFMDNVHRQGAGLLDVDDAILATARIEPGKLALGESEAGPALRTLELGNEGAGPVTYTFANAPALATGAATFTPQFFLAPAAVSFSPASVTVPAGGTASVDVTITAPATPVRGLYGGHLVATPSGGGAALRVPYAGFIGDYQSIPVLTPTVNNFPWLARLVGTTFTKQADGAVYTLAGGDVPWVLVHLDHAVRRLRIEVFEAGTGKAWHRAFEQEYVARNSGAATFFSLSWDGVTRNGNKTSVVPNGDYVLVLTVDKALGDAANPAHRESWTSPVLTLARP